VRADPFKVELDGVKNGHERTACSDLCTRAAGYLLMPSFQVSLVGLNTDVREPPEIDPDHRGDIGNGEFVARDEPPAD
jgi:hypothetical protein